MILFKVLPLSRYRISEICDATRRKLHVASAHYWCNRVANQDAAIWLQHAEGTGPCGSEGFWSSRGPTSAANRLALSPPD